MNIDRPAVFLDRDGVLTREKSYVIDIEGMEIFPYAAGCIRKIHQKGYLAVVVTNQSGIARGMITEDALREMNAHLIDRTGVDAVYFCPHHPDDGCRCRKPRTGLIEQACRDLAIDLSRSLMVGDRASDILAGQNAGMRTVLLESGYGTARLEHSVTPDHILEDLRDVPGLL